MKPEINKITYILGAGACANALPTVRSTPENSGYTDSLRELASRLRADITINPAHRKFCDKFCDDLDWLAQNGDSSGSIDTFALYCLREKASDEHKYAQLDRIKLTLSLYFIIKQFIDKKFDVRYKNFLTRLIDPNGSIFENVKILTWNYDHQLQIAAEKFRREEFRYAYGAAQHSAPAVPYYPQLGNEFSINAGIDRIFGGLSMVHLNGIAGFYYYYQNAHIQNYFLNHDLDDLNQLFERVQTDGKHKYQLMTFSFEEGGVANQYLRKRFEYAEQIIQDTDYLVIVGYSFPQDNFPIDARIVEVLLKSGKLKRIYFQDPYKSGDFLYELFNLDTGIVKEVAYDDKCFFIPPQIMKGK